jgi:hypothetical protein
MKTKLRPYSVLLLRPDYIADVFGHDTYYTFVRAADSYSAVAVARRQVCQADFVPWFKADDYSVLLVLKGHHKDLGYLQGTL